MTRPRGSPYVNGATDGGPFAALHDQTVRLSAGGITQTGFWVGGVTLVTCAHGFASLSLGDEIVAAWAGGEMTATVVWVDGDTDILILVCERERVSALLPLREGAMPGDELYGWGYTQRYPSGESVTVRMEGWSRDPYLLKVKSGLVEPGMSGAPLMAVGTEMIVGMLRITRDRTAPTGGRAVPASTILEVASLAGLQVGAAVATDVSPGDLAIASGMAAAAYDGTRPRAPVERKLFALSEDEWYDGVEMMTVLREVESHDDRRRDAMERWYAANEACLRFILLADQVGSRRIGVTCVLPLHARSFNAFRAGRLSEFDIDASDIVPGAVGGRSRWLLFQSFALAVRGTRAAHHALRVAIEEHVMRMAEVGRPPRVIAEIGTGAGLREARYFGLTFSGLSADNRPLFEAGSSPVVRA